MTGADRTGLETMTEPAPADPGRFPSRDDPGTTSCPVCARSFTPIGRQVFCSTTCRKTALRRRHQQPGAAVNRAGRPAAP